MKKFFFSAAVIGLLAAGAAMITGCSNSASSDPTPTPPPTVVIEKITFTDSTSGSIVSDDITTFKAAILTSVKDFFGNQNLVWDTESPGTINITPAQTKLLSQVNVLIAVAKEGIATEKWTGTVEYTATNKTVAIELTAGAVKLVKLTFTDNSAGGFADLSLAATAFDAAVAATGSEKTNTLSDLVLTVSDEASFTVAKAVYDAFVAEVQEVISPLTFTLDPADTSDNGELTVTIADAS